MDSLQVVRIRVTVAVTIVASVAFLATGQTAFGVVFPTAYEQYLVELVNRARSDPLAEVARYPELSDLNEGLDPGTISPLAKQPLAVNPPLMDAARGHSEWIIANDILTHVQPPDIGPAERMIAAGYVFVPPWVRGENIGWVGDWTTARPIKQAVEDIHGGLFTDLDYDGRAHRLNLMEPDYREIGAGLAFGDYQGWQATVATEDFASTAGNAFLTGVAYDDSVAADLFYQPGEGLGGATVTATHQASGTEYQTTTWAAGGYTLQLPAGTYTVTAAGGGLGGTVTHTGVVITDENAKRDFRPDMVHATLDIDAALDWDWVYQNTQTTTGDKHVSTLTITLVSEAQPGEIYDVLIQENGGALASFTVGTPQVVGGDLVVDIIGGRTATTTANAPGEATLTVTVTGDSSDESDSDTVSLQLRKLGDLDGSGGDPTALDKQSFNKRLNGIATGLPDRAFDLNASGGEPNAVDKQIMNQLLNGVALP